MALSVCRHWRLGLTDAAFLAIEDEEMALRAAYVEREKAEEDRRIGLVLSFLLARVGVEAKPADFFPRLNPSE